MPLQTADEFLTEVQSREQTEDTGARTFPEATVGVQTAADTTRMGDGTVGNLGSSGPFPPEAQTGSEIGPQGATGAGDLAGRENGVDPDSAVEAPVDGAYTGFHTPRSSRSAQISGFGALRSSVPGQWPGWVSRLGDLFKAPPIPNTWLPSPIPSPPPPPAAGGHWGLRPPVGARMDVTADGGKGYLRGSKGGNPSNTPSSSSIPAEAIQAEVQRQMGNLLTRLSEVESDNARLQSELRSERMKTSTARSSTGPKVPASDLGLSEGASTVRRSNEPPLPAVPEGRSDAWNMLWEGITGKRTPKAPMPEPSASSTGMLPRAAAVEEELPQSSFPEPQGGPINVIETLAQSMKQIQELQMKAMTKDSESEGAPEAVKTAVTILPSLGPPEGDQCGLLFQDWIVQVTTSMQDLSASSGTWWESVKKAVVQAYTKWLSASPLERLGIEPTCTSELVAGKWLRINARSCAMIIQAIPEAVKSDLIARRSTQSMPLLLFRLYTLYQPGGAGERATILQRLQGGQTPKTVEECLYHLRAWPRWVQRCQDMGMAVPDGSVLAKGLTTLTTTTINQVPDAMFRTQLVRATLRIDQQPALSDVIKYQQHLQAEVENLASSTTTFTTTHMNTPMVRATGVVGEEHHRHEDNKVGKEVGDLVIRRELGVESQRPKSHQRPW